MYDYCVGDSGSATAVREARYLAGRFSGLPVAGAESPAQARSFSVVDLHKIILAGGMVLLWLS